MRLTSKLCAQHIGWYFKKHWQVQGKRIPIDTGAERELAKLGIKVRDANDVVAREKTTERVEIPKRLTYVQLEDETHPDWHDQKCRMFENNNVLVEGVKQAQVLLKTVEINGLPENLENAIMQMHLPVHIDRNIQNDILFSHAFDAEQVVLPKVVAADRPEVNLPRVYGISHKRRHRLLVNKLIAECEKLCGIFITSRRLMLDDIHFKLSLRRDHNLLNFNVTAEKLITALQPLAPINVDLPDDELPVMHPIKCTISLPRKNVYTTETFYPISNHIAFAHPHTIFKHFDKEYVKNLHESEVTSTQFQSRSMMTAFAVAASRAKKLYGDAFEDELPKPIVVQIVQTDGRLFHFGVFQLNTLSIDKDGGVKNYWFHPTEVELFKECGYKLGRPYLEGYNKDVFRIINAFYLNA